MHELFSLADPLNLRDFITIVTDHIRNNGATSDQPRSIYSFLSICMKDISFEEPATIILIQKVLAASVPYTRLDAFSRDFCSGKYDTGLIANLDEVQETILHIPNAETLFCKLTGQMSLRFFKYEEREWLKQLCENGQYSELLLGLLKHGFKTLYNLPAFASERLYNEGQTLDYDSPRRYGLLKNSANLGHAQAALEVGNFLTKRGSAEEAYHYLSLALPLPTAIWNITFMLEIGQLSDDQFHHFRSTIDIDRKLTSEFAKLDQEKMNEGNSNLTQEELDAVCFDAVDPEKRQQLEFAYKVYFWLAKTDFFKGFNSLYKILRMPGVTVSEPAPQEKLRRKYLNLAIASGESTAASNLSCELLNDYLASSPDNPMDPEQEDYFLELTKLMEDSGEYRGPFNFARYLTHRRNCYQDTSIALDDICDAYARAQKLDVDKKGVGGYLPYNWAKILEEIEFSRSDGIPNRQQIIALYDDAIKMGLTRAAYEKAKHLFLTYTDSNGSQVLPLYQAKRILEDYKKTNSGQTDSLAEDLLTQIKKAAVD